MGEKRTERERETERERDWAIINGIWCPFRARGAPSSAEDFLEGGGEGGDDLLHLGVGEVAVGRDFDRRRRHVALRHTELRSAARHSPLLCLRSVRRQSRHAVERVIHGADRRESARENAVT